MEVRKTPILFHSNAPWVGSGYGAQAGLFGPLLARYYRLAFSAFYGLRGSRIGWAPSPNGVPLTVYPGGVNAYGNDVLGAHAKHWFQRDKDGFVLLLTDPWVIQPEIGESIPLAAWVPVDHDPLIPDTLDWFKRSNAFPITMSEFGKRVLADAGIRNAQYVPHGYDPAVFHPQDRKLARELLKLPQDAFIVGMVAANQGVPSRKCFSEALSAFSVFQRHCPEALLYLHTKLEHPHGEVIPLQLKSLGIKAVAADQYGLALGAPASVVASTLSAFDVLLNPSRGEGFGVPMLESQAVGTPVITTNFSASPEVAPESAGNWTVGGQKTWTQFHSYQLTPSIEELVVALIAAYEEADEHRQHRRESVAVHAERYTADRVLEEYFLPALRAAELEFRLRKQLLVQL